MPADAPASPALDASIRAEVARQLGVAGERIVPAASLTEDLGVDSLLHMTLVVGLEQRFEIMIPDSVAARFVCVGDVIDAVRFGCAAINPSPKGAAGGLRSSEANSSPGEPA